jgi:hypothetical protein
VTLTRLVTAVYWRNPLRVVRCLFLLMPHHCFRDALKTSIMLQIVAIEIFLRFFHLYRRISKSNVPIGHYCFAPNSYILSTHNCFLILRNDFKLSYPSNRPWRPIRLWDVKDPKLSRQLAHSSWLQNGDVLWFLWGTNLIYICYVEGSRPHMWSSGQSS